MGSDMRSSISQSEDLVGWARIGIASGFVACLVYPVMILVSVPRIPQLLLGASFGPALAAASVALARIMQARRRTPSLELAAIFNCLAGGLVTAMIIVQLAINYSSASATTDDQMIAVVRRLLWDVVLGLDVSFDVFIGVATLLFALNMLRDNRFGRIIGWIGVFVSVVPILGANIYYFPDPPYVRGFPHVGIFTGLWYLAVVFMLVRAVRRDQL